MSSLRYSLVTAMALLACPLFSQMRNSNAASDLNQHVFIVAPLSGSGTVADPIRPMFTPAQGTGLSVAQPKGPTDSPMAPQRTGIIAYHSQISDDGKYAIVEFIAPTLADLKEIISTSDSRVQVFVKGVHPREAIEAAFKVQKKDFSLDKFMMMGVR